LIKVLGETQSYHYCRQWAEASAPASGFWRVAQVRTTLRTRVTPKRISKYFNSVPNLQRAELNRDWLALHLSSRAWRWHNGTTGIGSPYRRVTMKGESVPAVDAIPTHPCLLLCARNGFNCRRNKQDSINGLTANRDASASLSYGGRLSCAGHDKRPDEKLRLRKGLRTVQTASPRPSRQLSVGIVTYSRVA